MVHVKARRCSFINRHNCYLNHHLVNQHRAISITTLSNAITDIDVPVAEENRGGELKPLHYLNQHRSHYRLPIPTKHIHHCLSINAPNQLAPLSQPTTQPLLLSQPKQSRLSQKPQPLLSQPTPQLSQQEKHTTTISENRSLNKYYLWQRHDRNDRNKCGQRRRKKNQHKVLQPVAKLHQTWRCICEKKKTINLRILGYQHQESSGKFRDSLDLRFLVGMAGAWDRLCPLDTRL